jgi:hypothetical protein
MRLSHSKFHIRRPQPSTLPHTRSNRSSVTKRSTEKQILIYFRSYDFILDLSNYISTTTTVRHSETVDGLPIAAQFPPTSTTAANPKRRHFPHSEPLFEPQRPLPFWWLCTFRERRLFVQPDFRHFNSFTSHPFRQISPVSLPSTSVCPSTPTRRGEAIPPHA